MVAFLASKATPRWAVLFVFLLGVSQDAISADGVSAVPGSPPTAPAIPSISPEVAEVMDHLEPLWENMKTDVVSCDAKFQFFYQVIPKSSLSRSQVHAILDRYQLADHPEKVTDFLREVAGPEITFAAPVHHLLEQGEWSRHDAGPVSYVHLTDFSFVIDHHNKQIHVYEPGRTPTTAESPSIFRSPVKSRAEGHIPVRVQRDGQVVHLESSLPSSHRRGVVTTKSTVDWATGVPLLRSQYLDSVLLQESLYSGLTTYAGGITFSRCCATIRYIENRVSSIELALLHDSRFNEPILERAFLVSKPETWKVLDFRGDSPGMEFDCPTEAVADVRTLIPESTTQLHSVTATQLQQITPMSIPLRAVLILNGTALIGLGIWMWRQSSLGGQKH